MSMNMSMSGAPPSLLRPEGSGGYMEKRQLFLRSYHFSRKKSGMEKLRCSAVRVRRLVCVRLRAARRLPRLLWSRLRCDWYGHRNRRRFRFQRLGPPASAWAGPAPSAPVIWSTLDRPLLLLIAIACYIIRYWGYPSTRSTCLLSSFHLGNQIDW